MERSAVVGGKISARASVYLVTILTRWTQPVPHVPDDDMLIHCSGLEEEAEVTVAAWISSYVELLWIHPR